MKPIMYTPVNPQCYKLNEKWREDLKKSLHECLGKRADQYVIDELVNIDIYRNDRLDAFTYCFAFKNTLGYLKGENKPMKKYDIDFVAKKTEIEAIYNKAVADAKDAKEKAMLEAEEARDLAKLREEKKDAAMALKVEYDAYIDAGFTPKQAEAFVMKTKDAIINPIYPVTCGIGNV